MQKNDGSWTYFANDAAYHLDKINRNFDKNIFLIGNSVLYLFGLFIFINLWKNYESRELVKSNINTIILQTLFTVFYIISLNLFFI